MRTALPNAIAVFICCTIVLIMQNRAGFDAAQGALVMYLSVGFISLAGVIKASLPFNLLRGFLAISAVLGFISAVILFAELLQLPHLSFAGALVLPFITALGLAVAMCIKIPEAKTLY